MRPEDGPAFSNGTEYESWFDNWCALCTWEPDCPLLLTVLLGEGIPPEWRPGTVYPQDAYHCTEFEEERNDVRGTS